MEAEAVSNLAAILSGLAEAALVVIAASVYRLEKRVSRLEWEAGQH